MPFRRASLAQGPEPVEGEHGNGPGSDRSWILHGFFGALFELMDAWMSVLLIHGQAHAVKGTNVEQKFAPSSKICVLKTNSAKNYHFTFGTALVLVALP
jgi:hypothetical protein